MGFVYRVEGPQKKLRMPSWKTVTCGCCFTLAPFCLILMAFNCGHAPTWKHFRLINKSHFLVRVIFQEGWPGIDVEPHTVAKDPRELHWDTMVLTYKIQKLAPEMEADEFYRVEGEGNIRSVTSGEVVTLTYPPEPPCETDPNGPAEWAPIQIRPFPRPKRINE